MLLYCNITRKRGIIIVKKYINKLIYGLIFILYILKYVYIAFKNDIKDIKNRLAG